MNVKAAFARAKEYEAPDPAPWPAPDMSLVSSERRDPPPFPAEVFGPWGDWIAAAAECKGAAPDYVGHALLTVAGSLIGNTRWAAPSSVRGCGGNSPSEAGVTGGAILSAVRVPWRRSATGHEPTFSTLWG